MNSTAHDLNWWLKWIGTVILIIGTGVNSMGFYPAGPLLLMFGGMFWLAVSIRWRETALIITNSVMFATAVVGLAWKYSG